MTTATATPVVHFSGELNFLKRKVFGIDPQWRAIVPVSQLISKQFSNKQDASELLKKLREALLKKSGTSFPKIAFIVDTPNGSRVVINVLALREHFADEIDGWSGGGGRNNRPLDADMLKLRRGR